ncbi:xanthine dehydrogenase family protein molybdopterin-binding subunit [Paroceanicella profunda]|uniref:Xanthine dehydrogenase family protein molybdopterin-binding subunit n=1 Tax=Paroceanicella profunda TaxID=2579971 RepID=A0A5B8FI17_9RHOB|nr:molybdopterin cofactor-binding domain-containing protein [Paroceanicella profunda]QDL93151.1 xanthine dehydrogenase family protein molybdopterin-binding subunit [Paroceanicella profunda]
MSGSLSRPTRRGFLGGAGALSFALMSGGGVAVIGRSVEAQSLNGGQINAWVTITPDDRMTIMYGGAEMGQGANTALPMIVAEELDADWSTVSTEQVGNDLDGVYGNPSIGGILYTAGSYTVEGYFNGLRQAGAQARQILRQIAAAHWNVPVAEVTTRQGTLLHNATGRTMRYGEVAALVQPDMPVEAVADEDLKPRSEWTIIGTDVDRLDIPDKTTGATRYSIDVDVPDMVYAVQLLAPVEGEAPTINSDAAARAIDGVLDVMALPNSVAVLARSFWAAVAGREALDVSWTETSPFRTADSEAELQNLTTAADDPNADVVVWESRGDGGEDYSAGNVITAHYTTEHVYHAQMEPLNVVASVDEDGLGAEIWIGTQSQTVSVAIAAAVLGTTPDRIRLNAMQMGGAFGRRTWFAREMLRDALILSRAAGRPVKLVWTREDDVKQGWLRAATVQRFDAILGENGALEALRHRVAAPSTFQFVQPDRWNPEVRTDPLIMEGSESRDYDIPEFRAEHIQAPRVSRLSAWRGIGWGPVCFGRECFIDELAEQAGSDPVSFRRRLLSNSPRGLGVFDAVVAMSDFGNAPEGRAHGIAFAGYKSSYASGVAEVSYEGERLRVHRFWAAVDPGLAIHPQSYLSQVEGGILFGLSSVLAERSSFTAGQIDQNNFYDYEPIRMYDVPEIEVQIIDSDNPPSGGGEIGVPMAAPAIANAVRALTGAAPNRLPFPRRT